MHENPSHRNDDGSENPRTNGLSRRDFLTSSAAMAGATFLASFATVSTQPDSPRPLAALIPGHGGLLYPQQNQHRNMLDLSGLWQFQLDPAEEGEAKDWFNMLPAPRLIAVPCSWNDLFDDARDYLGLAWYRTEFSAPSSWRGHCNRRQSTLVTGTALPLPGGQSCAAIWPS